jgi:integrase
MPAAAEKIAFTDRSLQALKPLTGGKRRTVWDAMLPGLAVRVSSCGKRSFYAVKRRAGAQQPTWILLGVYPITSLKEAREEGRKALGALMAGESPVERAETKRRAAAEAETKNREAEKRREAGTFRVVAETFIKAHLPRLRTCRPVEALIWRELIPALGEKQIGEIRRRDVIEVIEAIVARGIPEEGHRRVKSGGEYAARHALAALRKLLSWALARDVDGLDSNPCGGVKVADLLGAPKVRDRILFDHELRLIWRAAGVTSYPFGPLIRGLLLTGQRLREISEGAWSEINGDALAIPGDRMKGKAAHVVPLTGAMSALLDSLPHFTAGDYLFSTTGGARPVSGFSKMKARFDQTIVDLVTEDRAELIAAGAIESEAADRIRHVAHWTLHDLRRTMRTGMATAGVPPFIAELVIAHHQTGVHATYDLHRYDTEKRDALERWEKRLLNIVAPEPEAPNVIALPALARA